MSRGPFDWFFKFSKKLWKLLKRLTIPLLVMIVAALGFISFTSLALVGKCTTETKVHFKWSLTGGLDAGAETKIDKNICSAIQKK